jgi:hypothetical protein
VRNNIDSQLIDSVIQEERASADKRRQALEQASKEIEERRAVQQRAVLYTAST